MADWEHFSHGADIGVRGIGDSLAEAFEQAALAMTAVIADPATVGQDVGIDIHCEAPDTDLLLMDWLNELVYEMATRHALFSRFQVRIDGNRLHGRAWGEAVDPGRHGAAVEVKGATLTSLQTGRDRHGRWRAQCVVDV